MGVENNLPLLWFYFTACMLYDWFKNSHHLLKQSDARPIPTVTVVGVFSCAWHWLHVVYMYVHVNNMLCLAILNFAFVFDLQHSAENHSD